MAKTGLPAASKSGTPHPMLQALVAQFLASNGFNSSHRIYNTERKKRPRKEGWQDTFAKSYTADFPPLESIFDEWKNKYRNQEDTGTNNETSDETSDASSSSEDHIQEHKASSSTKVNNNQSRTSLRSASSSASDSSEDDSDEESDSSANEEQEIVAPPKIISIDSTGSKNPLKRKASDSSSESIDSSDSSDSSSDSESDLEHDLPLAKKQRVQPPVPESNGDSDSESSTDSDTSSDSESLKAAIQTKLPSSGESSSSGDTSDSDDSSDSSLDDEAEKIVGNVVPVPDNAGSDSSGTIMGDHDRTQSSSDSSSSDSVASKTQMSVSKKKHTGAQPTRLAQLSAAADINDYVSNTYVSYDYADKAFRDLSVTRGKGFTKEKNKKKRGSYRGGTIDIGGGKGFKFDD